jgi:hypothetical protein
MLCGSGMDRLQEAVDKLEEEKLIEITIPDVSVCHSLRAMAVKSAAFSFTSGDCAAISFTSGDLVITLNNKLVAGNTREQNYQIQLAGTRGN